MSALGAQFDFIKDEIRGAWRFRWIAMAIAWVVALGGWLVTCIMPNVFEARSRVYVETSTELRPLLQGLAIETDIQSQLDLVRQALLSTPTLSAVGEKAKRCCCFPVRAACSSPAARAKCSIMAVSNSSDALSAGGRMFLMATAASFNGFFGTLVDDVLPGTAVAGISAARSKRFPSLTSRVCNNNKYDEHSLRRPNCCASAAACNKSCDSCKTASYALTGWTKNNASVVVVILLLSL